MTGCGVLLISGYIGPGAGLGLLGALIAVLAAIGAALFFVAAWPVRMLLRRLGQNGRTAGPVDDGRPAA